MPFDRTDTKVDFPASTFPITPIFTNFSGLVQSLCIYLKPAQINKRIYPIVQVASKKERRLFEIIFNQYLVFDRNYLIIMDDIPITGSDLICFICQDFFCKPHTAACGHSFCRLCLQEYFLYTEICPVCSKIIRNKTSTPVPVLGQFVHKSLQNDQQQLESLLEREKDTKEYFGLRQLKNIKVGMKVDVRDSNYVWCLGMIIRIFMGNSQAERKIKVTYLNYLQYREQDILLSSDRLANLGFFTSRKDVPYYQDKKVDSLIKKHI